MFIGRHHELSLLRRAIESNRAELIVLYGRRRIGKSELLRQAARSSPNALIFEALQGGSSKQQIAHFLHQLSAQTGLPSLQAQDWHAAFDLLTTQIRTGRHYLVFDEFPWMACGRHELVSLLKFYWDNHWKQNTGLTLALCGSVANFMVRHIIYSQALHNRKTLEIDLQPLPANESKGFFRGLGSDFELAKFLMVFGGVPKYLEQVNPRLSLAQNLDQLCFQQDAFFLNEFETIFKEQFKVTKTYEHIARILAAESMSQQQLAGVLGMAPGGGLSGYVANMERAGFLRTFSPYDALGRGSRTRRLVLWDEWLRFYLTYMAPNLQSIALNTQTGLFEQVGGDSFDSYCGLAFERLCLRNIHNLLAAMSIPLATVRGFGPFFRQPPRKKGSAPGCQIDLIIRRSGSVLSVVECKFSKQPIGLSVARDMDRKIDALNMPASVSIERVLITASGITTDLEREGSFHHVLGLDAILGTQEDF
jgi:hypothetical protein